MRGFFLHILTGAQLWCRCAWFKVEHWSSYSGGLAVVWAILAGVGVAWGGEPRSVPLRLASNEIGARVDGGLVCPLELPDKPGQCIWVPSSPQQWLEADRLDFSLMWPPDGPEGAQVLVWLIDRDDHWYQHLLPATLKEGKNDFKVALTPLSILWEGVGHAAPWNYRTRLNPKVAGVRVFGNTPFTGECVVLSAQLVTTITNRPPPVITNLRPNAAEVSRGALYELRFDLPDRYADPYNPGVIDVSATFVLPDGTTMVTGGFYYQEFYRVIDAVEERAEPQGRPEWRVRYAPPTGGVYRVTVKATDSWGTAESAPLTFTVRETPPVVPFIKVSKKDPRYFETETGEFFYPLGHNIRSPFDTRMDDQFPWRFRHPAGSSAYHNYFTNMERAGENFVEIWMCAWSLGIEWSSVIRGYHGAGDYNLGNAWELDRVFEWARQAGIRVNLVLNNHGRVSSWLDQEWQDHPYNTKRGGWCDDVMEYFSDSRSLEMTKRLHQYIVARWGWDATVFTWELFSEIDLTGSKSDQRNHYREPVVEWHKIIGDHLRAIDPYKRPVCTHVSNHFPQQNPDLCKIPQLDHCAVDAYHSGAPHQIANEVVGTANFNNPFGKPVLITEFGGSPMAAGAEHLRQELHAALWAATAVPLAGAPLFWWWHVIEEEELYPVYKAVSRFMAGVDKRDPQMVLVKPQLKISDQPGKPPQPPVEVICSASAEQALGWLWTRRGFEGVRSAPESGTRVSLLIYNLVVELSGMIPDAPYSIEIVETITGQTVKRFDLRAKEGKLVFLLPPFERDCAFKVSKR